MAAKQLNIRIGDDAVRQLEYITQALQKRSPVPVNRGDALRWALREMYQREQELERQRTQDRAQERGLDRRAEAQVTGEHRERPAD